MTKARVSKIPLPSLNLLIYCVFLIATVLSGPNPYWLLVANVLLIAFILLALLKIRYALPFLAAGVAIILVNFAFFTAGHELSRRCETVQIKSQAKKFNKGFVYKVSGSQKYLIFSQKDEFKFSDQVKLCRREIISLDYSDERYLMSQFKTKNVYSISEVEKIAEGRGWRRQIADLSEKIRSASDKIYSGDKGVLAYGLLFGGGDFSTDAKANFKKSGTTHLVAVSGYNVSIITAWLFVAMRVVSKNFAALTAVVILAVFYFMTGGSASVLRAATMGLLVLLARFVGRRVLPFHLLLLAASLILIFNPFAIFDWGFQLSFLATAGLLMLSPVLERALFGKTSNMIIKIFCETLGAQIFVLPIMAANFGQFSLIAPLSNLFILPFIPLTMLFVAVGYFCYFLSPLIGYFFGGISSVLLSYIFAVINYSASLKFSNIAFSVKPIYAYTLGFLLVFGLTYLLRRRFDENKCEQDF